MADSVLTDILINSQNPDTLFAIGRGGVFRSLNLGTTWTSRNDGLSADSVNIIAIGNATFDQATMYVGTSNGRTYRSDNFGLTWIFRGSIGGASITRLVVDNLDSDIIYAGTANNGVHRSIDGGIMWTQFPGSNPATDILKIKSLVLDTSTPRKLYAGTDVNGVYQFTSEELH